MQTEAHREHNDSHRRLIRRLETQAADVERLTRGLDEGALSRRVDPEKWSLKELVAHLAIIQKLFRGRAERMLREDSPSLDA
jgi:hypothetical protein